MSVYDEGAPKPDSAIWSGRHPGPRHLLRRAPDGAGARRRRAAGHAARVRPGHDPDHRGRRPLRRHGPRAAGLDEPRRLDHPPAGRLPRLGQTDFDRVRGPLRPEAPPLRHPVPSRGGAHAARARTCCATSWLGIAGATPDLDAGQLHRVHGGRDPRARRRPRRRPARTGRSSARCRAASTRRWRRRSCIGRSAIG